MAEGIQRADDWWILSQPWRFFRLVQPDGSPYLFYRCPGCGAALDWRDHDVHLRFHGITNATVRAELLKQQEEYAGVQHT